jgi:hypothetical protein
MIIGISIDITSALMYFEVTLDSIVKLSGKSLREFTVSCIKMLPDESSQEDRIASNRVNEVAVIRWGDCFAAERSVWLDVLANLLDLFQICLEPSSLPLPAGANPPPAGMCGALEVLLYSAQRRLSQKAPSKEEEQEEVSRCLILVERAYGIVGRLSVEDRLVDAIVADKKRGEESSSSRLRSQAPPDGSSSLSSSAARVGRRSQRTSSRAKRQRSIYAEFSDLDEMSSSDDNESDYDESATSRKVSPIKGRANSRQAESPGENVDLGPLDASSSDPIPDTLINASKYSNWFRSAQRLIEGNYESPRSADVQSERASAKRGVRRRDVELWHKARKVVFSVRSEILQALFHIYQRRNALRDGEMLRFSAADAVMGKLLFILGGAFP